MKSAARYPAPPPLAEPQVSIDTIPSGFGGTQATVRRMISLIREGAKDFYVRQRAIDVLFAIGVPPKDYLGEIGAIFRFVQGHLRYTRDPHQTEVLHSARRLLSLRAGDCDDHTILLGAMLKSIGHPVRIVLTGPDPKRPRLFSHVYLEVEHRGEWIPLDATMPHPPGWQPNAPTRLVVPLGPAVPARETAGALEAARNLYHTFTAAAPDRARMVKSPRVIPPVVVGLGELVGLIYRSDKWEPGVPKTYIHYMERRPLLAADPTGRRLFIVGGRYRITERGIEG
jgi:transglutaminase-like putative cysteine protease